jgi:hypothetical protein
VFAELDPKQKHNSEGFGKVLFSASLLGMAPPTTIKSAGKARPKSRERQDVSEDILEPPVVFPVFDEAEILNEKWNVCRSCCC